MKKTAINSTIIHCSKQFIVLFMLVLSVKSWAAYCPLYQEQIVKPNFVASEKEIAAAVQTIDSELSIQLNMQSQEVLSAIATLTKQKALTGTLVADNERIVNQRIAEALALLSTEERVAKVPFDFSQRFGQGYDPCKILSRRKMISDRQDEMNQEISTRVGKEINASPGRYADRIAEQNVLLKEREQYCTEDQVASGLCESPGTLPGADLSIATLFDLSMEQEDTYKAKLSFINNIVGLPDDIVSTDASEAAATESYVLAKSRRDALVSSALASFKQLQLDYSGVKTKSGEKNLPLAMLFKEEVTRYFGGSGENDAWNASLWEQSERGVLVELLRMKALDLAIQEKVYRQYERMEAQLATLVSLELDSSGVKGQADATLGDAIRQNVGESIN